jgi:mannosyltransferase
VASAEDPGRSPGLPSIVIPVAIVGAVVLALTLGLVNLDDKNLWLDEGVSVASASGDVGSAGRVIETEPNFALYYGVLHVWQLFGTSEFWVRLLSVLAFAAGVLLTAAVASRVFGRGTAAAAALLTAVNGLALTHAQEARSYTLAMALAAATTLLFLDAMERPIGRRWAAWAVVSIVAVFMHPFCGFVLAGQVLSLALLPRDRVPWRQAGLATLVTGLALVPLAVLLANSPTERIDWIPAPDLGDVIDYAERVAGGGLELAAYLALGGVAVVSALLAARGGARRDPQIWRVGLIVLWLLCPFVLGFIVSLEQPLLQSRYLIVALPPLTILAAAGLVRLRWAPAVAGGLVALFALGIDDVSEHYERQNADWRSAARVIAERADETDTVVVHPHGAPALAYYLERGESPVTDPAYGPPVLARGPSSLDPGDRIWLVYFDSGLVEGGSNPPPRALVGRRRALLDEWSLHRIGVMLYAPERA